MSSEKNFVIGVDFGTDSVRSVLVNAANGQEISSAPVRSLKHFIARGHVGVYKGRRPSSHTNNSELHARMSRHSREGDRYEGVHQACPCAGQPIDSASVDGDDPRRRGMRRDAGEGR